jgi:hypothetical protein
MWKPFSYSPIFRICFYAQRQTSSRLYLDPAVPGGISIFVTLAEKEGIRTGLECLRADIGSGRIDQVRDRFDSDQGDSLFSSRKRKTEEVGGLSRVFPGPPVAAGWYPWVISGLMFSVVG